MSRRIKSRLLIIPLSLAALLGACAPGGGYAKKSQWDYDKTPTPTTTTTAATQPAPVVKPQTPKPAPTPSRTSANLPVVKVALLAPLSGKHAKLGQSMLNAAQIALFDTGHNNYQLIPKDTRGNAQTAQKAAQDALKEGAELIIGPVFAESVRAVKPIASASRVNILAFSTDWSLAGDNTFIMGFLPFDQVERLTRYVATKDIGRIGVLAPNDNYGRVVMNAYKNASSRYGLQTTASQTFNPRSRSLNADIKQFTQFDKRAANSPPPFDAVLMPVGGQTAITLANLMTQYNLPPTAVKRLGTGLMDDTALAGEPSLNGTWFAAPSPNLRHEFEQKYMSTYGRRAPRLASLAYDATALSAILAQRGFQNGGRPQFDRASLMNPNGFFGIDGVFRFRRDGTAERGLAILEIARGRINVIDEAPRTFEQTQF